MDNARFVAAEPEGEAFDYTIYVITLTRVYEFWAVTVSVTEFAGSPPAQGESFL